VPTPSSLRVRVNGDAVVAAGGSTVADLLRQLDLDRHRVAVELNREIVPRAEHARQLLADGDQLEIVTFVGGG
jgi:sulfur carrier protein